MAKVITGLFESGSQAASAVDDLVIAGVPLGDISVVATEGYDVENFGVETHSKAAEGAAVGAGVGGAIGAIIAGFTAVGAIATGGAGLLVAGPLVAALAGAGAGAAGGSVLGGLVGLAIPEHEVKFYEDALKEGKVLVGVQCHGDDRSKMVKRVLERYGATRVSRA